ncbi:reverse transcriptase domain-containing protein [Tanacetum coccineum]
MLEKDTPFEFDDECQKAFKLLKEKLTCAPVIISLNWNLSFELMCDASDFVVGAVLDQKDEWWRRRCGGVGVGGSRWRVAASDIGDRVDPEVGSIFGVGRKSPSDRKGTENVTADHLSRIKNDESSDDSDVDDNFPGETLMEINTKDEPWFADFANYLEPYLFKVCSDGMIRRCVSGPETRAILDLCHHEPIGGHYRPNITAKKGIDFMGPFPKSHKFEYILVAVDYVSKWAEAQALPTNDARVCCHNLFFLEENNSAIRNAQTLISDRVKDNPAIWSRKLDDTLWAFRSAYKTPTGTTPYKLIYRKYCHLPFEIEHRAYWAP